MGLAAVVGTWGLHAHPVDMTDPFLGLIEARSPGVFAALVYGYATLWFTHAVLRRLRSCSRCSRSRRHAGIHAVRTRPLPTYAQPEDRPAPTLVLGETHFETMPGRAPSPEWLTIPQRGLYTGVMVVGAVGTGKTSACMYPYADQLLRWRAGDPDHKIGGLVLEVKGDFCKQVRGILTQAGRERDYVEIGLDSGYCYNPLHNDLDPYAVAYAIAALLNNLFGKSKEPFWQQAYTDLLKFVILLRRITDGYTTLSEVYRYILEPSQIEQNISQLDGRAQGAARSHHRVGARLPRSTAPSVRGRCGLRENRDMNSRIRTTPTSIAISPPRTCRFASRKIQQQCLADATASAAGDRPLVQARLESLGQSSALVDHRGRCGVPVALRRQPTCSRHVLSAALGVRRRRQARANAGRFRRSTNCSKPGRSSP